MSLATHLSISLAQHSFTVGRLRANAEKIVQIAQLARDQQLAKLVVFPELALTGYPPEDLLLRKDFLSQVEQECEYIRHSVHGIYVIFGHPKLDGQQLFNTATVLHNGERIAEYYKRELPNYSVFDEKRYFTPGQSTCVFKIADYQIGLTICEDLWTGNSVAQTSEYGADFIININASPFHMEKHSQRTHLLAKRCAEIKRPIIYLNLVGGQDELVFDGDSMIVDAAGDLKMQCPEFECGLFNATVTKHHAKIEIHSNWHTLAKKLDEKIYRALTLGIRDYYECNRFNGVVIGLSGGIDSALCATLAADALGPNCVKTVMMPSRYTSQASLDDAQTIAKVLGVHYDVISIEPMYQEFLHQLQGELNIVEGERIPVAAENIQARIRGTILMAIANRWHSLVLATGNKSEMAVGYATLYGDMVGGFAPLKDINKTLVYRLAHYRNAMSPVIPKNVIERAPSAELAPNQKDQDLLPSYDLLDKILELYVEHDYGLQQILSLSLLDEQSVRKVIRMIDLSEYKRRQAAPGILITKRAFGKDRRYPLSNAFDANWRA